MEEKPFKKCDMIGCPNEGTEMHMLGPGTTVYICKGCADRMRAEEGVD